MRLLSCHQMTYESWREQVQAGERKTHGAEIGNVFLIDRGEQPRVLMRGSFCGSILPAHPNTVTVFADVDFVTPLCSQVVYEGLVDDIFRIKCGGYQ